VESELEEEALLATGPWRVLWWVTLPRCRGTIVAAALWLALQAAADISVTDMLLVPTLAEEVHTRFTMGGRAAVAAALRLVAPALLLIWVFLLLLVPRLERSLPPLQLGFRRRPLFDLGRWRWLWLAGCVAAGVLVMIVPVLALVAKLGLAGSPRAWSAEHAGRQFAAEFRLYGLQVLETIIVALLTGALAAILALVACRGAEHGRGRRFLLLALVTLAWALPAPVVGIGLKETIQAIVRWCPNTPLPALLYDGPSPAPIVWAHVLRFFPFAVAIVWPALRMVPPELRDAARLEGAGAFQELVYVDWPMTRKACGLAALAVAALSLGEVGAGARVETPGGETFAKLLFDRMHYGVDASVAGLALVLLTEVLVFAACGLAISRCLAKPQAANH
jgi:iron(III) transport system permease protein